MARMNPVYISALSNPLPIPRKNKFLDERDIDKKGPTAVLPSFTNPYPVGSISYLMWQSVYGQGTAGSSSNEINSIPENIVDTSGNSPAPVNTGPPPRGKVFGRGYDEDEINESEAIGGRAVYSGGGNVGGVIGGEDKLPKYAPYKTLSEYAPPQNSSFDDTIYDEDSTNPGGQVSNSLENNPDAASGTSSVVNVPNSTATVGSTGGGLVQSARNWWNSDDRWWNSDKRLKTNIKLIGKSEQGYNIYSFRFINPSYGEGTYQGVISSEMPDQVVSKNEDGYDMVDYSMIDVEFKKIDEYSRLTKTNNKNMGKIIAKSGVELNTSARCRPSNKRIMTSRDTTIKSDLSVDNIMYKGNANLLAQR